MSKGLESLERIKKERSVYFFSKLYDLDMWQGDISSIEKELKDGEECKEVLKLLIKKYGFRVYEYKDFEGNEHKGLTTHFPRDGFFTLPQEEYDLLKKVLKDSKND